MMGNFGIQPKILGYAGHGNGSDRDVLRATLRQEVSKIQDALETKLIAISGATSGGDLVFLRTCVELRIPTIVVLPFSEHRLGDIFDDPEEWELARKLMGVCLAKYVSPGNNEAPEAYQSVSRNLIEWADAFLFVWDGEQSRALGDTGQAVQEASEIGLPTRIIDPVSFKARWTIPLDPKRSARHGFETRQELLDFLDLRFAAN